MSIACFFGKHKWDTRSANVVMEKIPKFVNNPGEWTTISFSGTLLQVSGYIVFKRCSSCGKEEAYFTDGFTREWVDPIFARRRCF
jgi:hypothetical protein